LQETVQCITAKVLVSEIIILVTDHSFFSEHSVLYQTCCCA